MTPHLHSAAWAEQLRTINQAFARREQALSTQLTDRLSELEKLRSRVAELTLEATNAERRASESARREEDFRADQRGHELAGQAESAAAHEEARARERLEWDAVLEVRLKEQQERQDLEHEASLKSLRENELARVQAECNARLDTAERAFRDDLERLRDELQSSEQRRAHVENALRAQVDARLLREQEVTAQWLGLHSQLDQGRTADAARHREERVNIDRQHLERELALASLAASMEAELRGQIERERQLRLRVQQSLQEVQGELAAMNESLFFRLTTFFRARATSKRPIDSISPVQHGASLNDGPEPPRAETSVPLGNAHGTTPRPIRATTMNTAIHSGQTEYSQSDLPAILRFAGDDFVQTAYWSLLGRKVDANGLLFYRARLLEGVSKLQILAEIASSPESVAHGAVIAGFQEAVRRQRVLAMPVIGRLIGLVRPAGQRSAVSMQLQALEARTEYGLQGLGHRLDGLDQALAALRNEVRDLESAGACKGGKSATADGGLNIPGGRFAATGSALSGASPLEAASIRARS